MIYLRTDGNSKIGHGHLNRCIIIAEELTKRKEAYCFIFCNTPDNIIEASSITKSNFIKVENEQSYLRDLESNSLLILDLDYPYFTSKEFQDECHRYGLKTMQMTVNDKPHYYCDILLNQNIIANNQNYKTESFTKKLFGPQYFIYRKQFREASRNTPKVNHKVKDSTAFVCFGGADPSSLTTLAIEVLLQLKQYVNNIEVVVGASNNNLNQIKELCNSIEDLNVVLHVNITNIEDVMMKSNFGIVSCGGTFWELALLGIPSFCFASSEREKASAEYFDKMKYTVHLGSYDEEITPMMIADKIKHTLNNGIQKHIFVEELNSEINAYGIEKVVNEILLTLDE